VHFENYTLLLLGPSPFEHWLESYLYITVRPLCFCFLQPGPLHLPQSRSSLCLLLCCTPPPSPGPERRPAALCPSDLAPRVTRSLLPPPALPSLAVPRSSTSGRCPERPPRRPVGHAGAARHSAPSRVISLSLSFSPTNRALLQNLIEPLSPAALPLLSPHDTESPPLLLAGILLNHATPPKFPRPIAFSPPPLTPRADPVQLRPPLHRNWPHPEPPLTGATRASPRRRQHPSATPSADPSTETVSPPPPDARARVSFSCSPALRREQRRAATAADLPVVSPVPLLPVVHVHLHSIL
jgi:hypothetical protein